MIKSRWKTINSVVTMMHTLLQQKSLWSTGMAGITSVTWHQVSKHNTTDAEWWVFAWRRKWNCCSWRWRCCRTPSECWCGSVAPAQQTSHRLSNILIDRVVVLQFPTWHKIGHFGDVSQSQSLGLVWKKTKPNTTKACIHQSKEMYNTKN